MLTLSFRCHIYVPITGGEAQASGQFQAAAVLFQSLGVDLIFKGLVFIKLRLQRPLVDQRWVSSLACILVLTLVRGVRHYSGPQKLMLGL
jgi:hypothetical protein